MTDHPLVDIVMAAYNSGASVSQSIESVLKQSYKYWRLWICDDASKDQTIKIAESYTQKHKNIMLLIHTYNQGPATARNTCLKHCDGAFIAFLDSDDTWHPDKLLIQVAAMQRHELLVTYTEYWIASNDNNKKRMALPSSVNLTSLLRKNLILLSSAMIRRENNRQYTMPNVPHEDYVFWCRLIQENQITAHLVKHKEPLCTYQLAENSISHNKLRAAYWHWRNLRRDLHLPLIPALVNFSAYILSSIRKYKDNFSVSMIKPLGRK